MLPSNLANIESISKMLTTFAALKSLKNKNISLDSPIYPYLYSDWQAVAGLGFAPGGVQGQVTFRELLTHRSGWPTDGQGGTCGGPNTDYATLKAHIQQGTIPLASGQKGQYSNCNFALFRELLPQMEPSGNGINLLPDNLRAQASAQFYIDYVVANVQSATATGSTSWNCTPVSSPSTPINQQILSYPPPNAAGSNPPYMPPLSLVSSTNWGDYFLLCGAGGWNLSPSDVYSLFTALAQGSGLLTPDLQAELFDTTTSPNYPGLGWDNTIGYCPGATANGQTYAWCKNGGEGLPPGPGIETFVGLFKCNSVTVVVFVNTALGPNGVITSMVTDAFSKAQVSGNKPCP
jgi:CubicO group peptidase (beta-lactamase class C family)